VENMEELEKRLREKALQSMNKAQKLELNLEGEENENVSNLP